MVRFRYPRGHEVQVQGWRLRQCGIHSGLPFRRGEEVAWATAAVHPPERVCLERELAPKHIPLLCSPIRIEVVVVGDGEVAGMDGHDADPFVCSVCDVFSDDRGGGAVAALVGREVLEQHALDGRTHRTEFRSGSVQVGPVGIAHGEDGVLQLVAGPHGQGEDEARGNAQHLHSTLHRTVDTFPPCVARTT